ncbi:MAG: PorP/SprF family type IX secretion system membrane protein [Chitinophagales bacterium]
MRLCTKKNLCFIFVCLFVQYAYTQIQPNSTHYMYNPQLANPAFYGSEEGINFGANYRHQWAKLNGQPKTVNIFADAYLRQAHGGIGLSITNDNLGAYNTTVLNVGYAFIQNIKDKIKISIGINSGFTLTKLDGTKLITPEGDNTGLNDDYLSAQVQKKFRPNLNIGIAIRHKYIEAGIAYSNLINAKDKFEGVSQTLKLRYGGVMQTYLTSKVKIRDNFFIKPAFVLYTDFKEIQTDISILAGYRNYVSLGLNVRGYNKKSLESLSPIIVVGPIKNICIIYSYDVSLSKLNMVNKGSHEITLKYLLPENKIYKNPITINNPRFL